MAVGGGEGGGGEGGGGEGGGGEGGGGDGGGDGGGGRRQWWRRRWWWRRGGLEAATAEVMVVATWLQGRQALPERRRRCDGGGFCLRIGRGGLIADNGTAVAGDAPIQFDKE